MRRASGRAVAATVALMIALAPLGALAGVAVHWYVIQPSDADLEAAARTLADSPIAPERDPVATGQWAPSFTRGTVHWDVESDVASPTAAIESAVADAGWRVGDVDADSLRASRGTIRLEAAWTPTTDGVRARVRVERGRAVPSIATAVSVGACLGALAAVLVIRRVRRPAHRIDPMAY